MLKVRLGVVDEFKGCCRRARQDVRGTTYQTSYGRMSKLPPCEQSPHKTFAALRATRLVTADDKSRRQIGGKRNEQEEDRREIEQ